MASNTTNYTPSRVWCHGCEEYRYGDGCANTPALKYGKRLGNTKDTIPCWLVRGTLYCKFKDQNSK